MPIVPTFTREDLPQIMPTGPQADVGAAGVAGEALQRGGAVLSNEALDYFNRHIEQEIYDYTATNSAGIRTNATNTWLKLSATAKQTGNYDGLTNQVNGAIASDLQQRLQSAPSPRAAAALTRIAAGVQDEFNTKASLTEGEGNEAKFISHVDTNVDQSAIVALHDPTQADAAMGQVTAILKGAAAAGLSPTDVASKLTEARNKVYGAAAQGILNRDDGATRLLAGLNAGNFDNVLNERQLSYYYTEATNRQKAENAEAERQMQASALLHRSSVDSAVRDNVASLSDTGKPAVPLTRDQIAVAYPRDPERVDTLMAALDQARAGYIARQSVAMNSPADDEALLAKMKPSIGPGYADRANLYDTVLSAIQQKQKFLSTDPVAYVRSVTPELRPLLQAAGNDPKQISKVITAQDAIFDRLGVPPDQRSVLTRQDANAIAGRLSGIDPMKGDVGAALDGMAKTYGDAWPRVFADLSNAGLPSSVQILASMDGDTQGTARQEMQRLYNFREQKGGSKAIEDLTASATPTLRSAVPDLLAPFRKTVVIPGASTGTNTMSVLTDAVTLKAQGYVMQGVDPQTAANKAYDDIIGQKYDIEGTMRVLKGRLPQAYALTDKVLSSLKPEDLLGSAGMPPGIAADRTASMKKFSAWYPSNTDDGGLILMTQTTGGTWIRVLRPDKTPVQVSSHDIAKAVVPPSVPQNDLYWIP